MTIDHREIAFEDAIEQHLLTVGGYEKGDERNFDRERAIDPLIFLWFVRLPKSMICKSAKQQTYSGNRRRAYE